MLKRILKRLKLKRRFEKEMTAFWAQQPSGESTHTFSAGRLRPILKEWDHQPGVAKGHYFHQDFLVARRIFERNPTHHVDIGSRIDGFVTHVASFREIEVFDIRPLAVELPNIEFRAVDFMDEKADEYSEYCDSLSSLHVIEHFGLGRYGDPIDFYGHLKGLQNFHRILKPGGILYLSTPIGAQRVEFNAHRVFSIKYLLSCFKDRFEVLHFSYVNDKGQLFENVSLTAENIEDHLGCKYGCGIFELEKI